MKKILITGGEGFIGKNLVEKLSEQYEIFSPKRNELDLCETDAVEDYLKNNKVDIVIHAANLGERDREKLSQTEVMVHGLRMYANLERCNDLYEKMYYFGSGAEYSREHYIPYMTEEYFGRHVPNDGYGFYKYVISKLCSQRENIYDLRLFGIYGKYEQWPFRFISSNICRVLNNMPMTLSQNAFFDYIHIDDLVNIMYWFIENKPKYHHYNVCRGSHIDLYSLGLIIRDTLQSDSEFHVAKEGYKPEYSGCNRRLIEEIGEYNFKPFEEAIMELAEYYRENMDMIDTTRLI